MGPAMKEYVVYYNMGLGHEDQAVEVFGRNVEEAITSFIHNFAPVGAVLAIIEKERTL
jgi:hypothetical protein